MQSPYQSTTDADIPHRRERAAIAAQACQTCRTRKSKCDEQRPRCGLCQRLDVECHYREPLPTKKDKTLVHILESLNRLESKFDNIAVALPSAQSTTASRTISPISRNTEQLAVPGHDEQLQFTDAHAVFTWPTVYVHLIATSPLSASSLPEILQHGSAWFRQLQTNEHVAVPSPDALLQSVNTPSRDGSNTVTISFPLLTIQQTQIYAEAYFHTYNVLFPVLDQETFLNDIAAPILRHGYKQGDIRSVIALLVYALGQLAMEGTLDDPVSSTSTRRSGIRGGTTRDPPGLPAFNEARKRMGLLLAQFSVEDVQMRLLMATYMQAAAMHVDFWRTTLSASATCELLVRDPTVDWKSSHGEVLKGLYWTCYMNEVMALSNLGLPTSSLVQLRSTIPAPSYYDASRRSTGTDEEGTPHRFYFPAILALESLIQEIHSTILVPVAQSTRTKSGMTGPAMPALREMARQLEAWRSLLPRAVQWLDGEMYDYPSTEHGIRRPLEPIFAIDQGPVPIRHRYNLDITTAHLRSRFYLAKHLLYQPFVYKVLHFPELLIKEDVECAAMALKAALMWPILLAPPKDKKRLIPYPFSWTQTCMSTLLIFKMTRVSDQLKRICEESVDLALVKSTVSLMLDWIHDIQQVDSVAAWGWQLLESLFVDTS